MLLGHFGVALAAKKVAPKTSLGTLFLAAQLADFIWPVFLLAGWEQVRVAPGITRVTPFEFVNYPYTHSLLAMMMWSAGLAGGYVLLRRASTTAAQTGGVLAALVISHWFLDWLVHIPDLPVTWLSGSRYGLGLWNSIAATAFLEFGLLAAGCAVYFSVTRSKNRAGRFALGSLLAVFVVAWLSQFGPPPPSETAVAFGALLMWLTVPWGAWADRNREAR